MKKIVLFGWNVVQRFPGEGAVLLHPRFSFLKWMGVMQIEILFEVMAQAFRVGTEQHSRHRY
jgi:hypothetical protein